MEFISTDELVDLLKSSGIQNFKVIDTADSDGSDVAEALRKDREIWKLFIIFALLMLLVEVLLLRFWK